MGRTWSFSTPVNGSSSHTASITFPGRCNTICFTVSLRSIFNMWLAVVAGQPGICRWAAARLHVTATAGWASSTWLSLAYLITIRAKRTNLRQNSYLHIQMYKNYSSPAKKLDSMTYFNYYAPCMQQYYYAINSYYTYHQGLWCVLLLIENLPTSD